ncbi:ICOS ligand [Suncus etruscus]|uniref:ICOS ligand n=1 Tax=Suncus etruscus TaxID=109475 RepID=UPI00210FF11F|nr:ICOS ligand [Suncus etruscus]
MRRRSSAPRLLLLLLLLLSPRRLRAGRPDAKVTALLGSSVKLPCVSPEPTRLELHLLHVYWQIPEQPKDRSVASYLNGSGQRMEPRAQLVPTDMRRGDFSLHLANVTLADQSPYRCLVFRKMEKMLERTVQLLVGANYSEPVVTCLEPEAGEDQVCTCTSSDGYPLPRVHWIEADGSPLAGGLQNTTVQSGARGLYSVVSVLRLRQSRPAQVRCCVENQLLGQNRTSRQLGEAEGTEKHYQKNGTTPSPRPPEEPRTSMMVLLAVGMVVGVSLAMAVGWLCRNRWPYSTTQGFGKRLTRRAGYDAGPVGYGVSGLCGPER